MARATPGQPITAGTWNINQRNKAERVLRYLRASRWNVLALQEVNERVLTELEAADDCEVVGWKRLADEAGVEAGSHGAVVLVRGDQLTTGEARLMPDDPYPGRGIAVELVWDGAPLTFVSWHSAHAQPERSRGINKGQAIRRKMAGYRAVAALLQEIETPALIGLDANHWNLRTSLDLAEPPAESDRYYDENLFFSAGATHRLQDTLLSYLAAHPQAHAELMRLRPDGPLHVTHRRGGHGKLDRLDYLLATEEFEVHDAFNDYDVEACRGPAGSDHGFVAAELSWK